MQLPERGSSRDDVIARLRERKRADADWKGGRTWSLIYPADLHMMVSPAHAKLADAVLADLREAVAQHGTSKGVQARYSS
jgi:hypothetical protein